MNGTQPGDVADLIRGFVRAYNRGNGSRLEEIFAREPDFEWYAVSGERTGAAAEDRGSLIPYFQRRHRVGDRFKMVDLRVEEERAWHGGYDFSFRVTRSSEKSSAEGTYHGKGAADCAIYVWSMGKRPGLTDPAPRLDERGSRLVPDTPASATLVGSRSGCREKFPSRGESLR